MKHGYGAYIKESQGPVQISVVILSLMLLSQVLGCDRASQPVKRSKLPVHEAHKQQIAGQIASGYGLGPFQPSLEMKENADFLLTPALIVQEAISDDIVITYPTE